MAEAPTYTVTTYDCATDLPKIEELAALADSKQVGEPPPFDPRVLPWTHKCFKGHKSIRTIRHYVAQKADGTIVGWLLAETRRRFTRTYVYLHEISATRVKSPEHAGIGRALHAKLVEDAKRDGALFIYLYPLTEDAAATYTRWGYHTPKELNYGYPDVKQQFLALAEKSPDKHAFIPTDLLDKLAPPKPELLFTEAHALAIRLGDKELAARIISRAGRNDPSLNVRLQDAMETIAVFTDAGEDSEETLSDDEQLAYLRDLFPPTAGGRRKTARNTHRLRFLRKHHLAEHGYSLSELSKISKVSQPILQQVYDRGIGAYKTNPTSVRMKGTFRKGVKAPYSKKLSKEQWAMARVYSFLDGNPKHDTDLRRKTRRNRK